MIKLFSAFMLFALLMMSSISLAEGPKKSPDSKPPSNAKVFFANLKDGQTIPTKFKVQMGLEGMKLRNASEDIDDKMTGHHHILINKGFVPEGQAIPADETHIHFGKSQSEAELNLKPGNYTLTLQLADGGHRSYGEKLSSTIKVTVK